MDAAIHRRADPASETRSHSSSRRGHAGLPAAFLVSTLSRRSDSMPRRSPSVTRFAGANRRPPFGSRECLAAPSSAFEAPRFARRWIRSAPRFYLDGTAVAPEAVVTGYDSYTLSLDLPPSGVATLAWACPVFRGLGDSRRLGLPIAAIDVDQDRLAIECAETPALAEENSGPS